jgi:hypothetical protein
LTDYQTGRPHLLANAVGSFVEFKVMSEAAFSRSEVLEFGQISTGCAVLKRVLFGLALLGLMLPRG